MANKLQTPNAQEDQEATLHGLEDGALVDDLSLQTMQNLGDVLPELVQAQQQGELKTRPVGRPTQSKR